MISNASEIHPELERILESRMLRESQQLRHLLRYIVEETIEGRKDGLKEYILGRQVFHRPPDYDPRNDAIVRVQASLLRKRLAAYYEDPGRESKLRIELPRGGYVPRFVEVDNDPPVPAQAELPVDRGNRRWPLLVAGVIIGAALTGLSLLLIGLPGQPQALACPALWRAYLEPGVETVVSFGVPLFYEGGDGLYVRDTHVNRLADDARRITKIGELLVRRFRPQEDVYTGIGDAIGTHFVAQWLERRGTAASVANSNYIGPSDIEGRNLVVVSSARFRTILQQMNLPARINFDPEERDGGFLLDDPAQGELPFYNTSGGSGVSTSHALVSLWPSSNPRHRLMYISGIQTWSTQAAAEYVLDHERQADLQRRLDADPEMSRRGKRSPFFQVLLRVEGKNNRSRAVSYVTHRYLPDAATERQP